VAIDGTSLHTPDDEMLTWRYPKRAGEHHEFGYPLLRLLALVECGTRAVLAAAFGPETTGELGYAHHLLAALDRTMLVLADAGFDAVEFLADIAATSASFLVRSSARRSPTPQRHLPDGSYLARLGYGILSTLLPVRIIEATVTITLADGTIRHEQWRLITNLLDHTRHPARELVDLYHERWQIETTYYSIKATILDGRILRSHTPTGIDQEVYALLTVYQALIRTAADTATAHPNLDMDRISFTILLDTAGNLVTTATGILPDGPTNLIGAIGQAVLNALLPTQPRHRTTPRTRKHRTSKYRPTTGSHPATTQTYTLHTEITFFEHGLAPRTQR
jgi:hypothetical protein